MSIQNQIALCTDSYQKWKDAALNAKDVAESRKALEKAFFWLELQTAFTTLFALERASDDTPETQLKIIVAKANLSKRLADYANAVLDELKW